jgi:hypothetical protein
MQLRANCECNGEQGNGIAWDWREDVLDAGRSGDEQVRPVAGALLQSVQKFVKHSNTT